MEGNKQDELKRAYAMLASLRKNIDQMISDPTDIFVQEFHNVLDRLESIGIEVSEFRVPESQVFFRKVDRAFMLTKLDAILGYFEIITSEKPRRIGFSPPETK